MPDQNPPQNDVVFGNTRNAIRPQALGDRDAGHITTPAQPNAIKQITIRQLNHGYIVDVGCHTFAIEGATNLISKLAEYITEPIKTEEKWFAGKLF